MHPWGKWGKNFVEYGIKACQDALADAGLEWKDIQFVLRRRDRAQRLPGLRRRGDLRPGPRLVRRASRDLLRGVRLRRDRQSNAARAQILAGLCDVALVVGADTTPKGFLAPTAGERWHDPDWLRFRLLGRHQPHLLRPLRAPAHGDLTARRRRTSPRSRSRTAATASRIPTRATRRPSPRRRC